MMDAFQRAVPVPKFEIVVHRALRRQVFRHRLPLAPGPQHVENPIQDPAHIHRPFASAVSRWRDHRRDNSPFVVGQIAWVTQAAAVRGTAMFGCPHRALLRESSAQQGITSDSSDSRTFRIGSKTTEYPKEIAAAEQVEFLKQLSPIERSQSLLLDTIVRLRGVAGGRGAAVRSASGATGISEGVQSVSSVKP